MRGFLKVVVTAALIGIAGVASAQDLIPDRRVVVTEAQDLPGGDIASVFDTTIEACERACLTNDRCTAYVYNTKNGSCFVKQNPGEGAFFQGAYSAYVIDADAGVQALATTRRAELVFLPEWDITPAFDQAAGLGRQHTTGPWTAEEHLAEAAAAESRRDWANAAAFTGAALNLTDDAATWAEFARRQLEAGKADGNQQYYYFNQAFLSSINAYLRADNPALQHNILVTMGDVLVQNGRGRDTVQALRLAQSLQDRTDTAALLDDAIAKYGFRIEETIVQSDLARPRICVTFTEDLSETADYSTYVQITEPGLVVESGGWRQLCVAGLEHGKRYTVTFREGLPAADGQAMAKSVEVSQYIRDRAPGVRFPGRGYVLPKAVEAALPVETVNTEKLDLTLFRVTDRNLLRSIQDYYFGAPIEVYSEYYFTDTVGEEIWTGSATVAQDVNKDVTTRLPLDAALEGMPAGIYALKAAVPGVDQYVTAPAWQWFVISDLGVTTMSGVDGLHVFVRSLGTAGAKPGVEVELLNRANSILGTATTDDQGYAMFDAGLTRGTGGSAPAMVVVKEGTDDIAFLSLTDPEFDLSDRGVEGREAAPPVDVYVTTDRGAYRAGETVYVTALARDPEQEAVEGLPLTAILTRPDGVEYSRQLVEDQGAGGHVFSLPIGGNAPRGIWQVDMYGDLEAGALATKTFLVEDFLPERIDFDLTMADAALSLGSDAAPDLTVDARYLFGAPGAGLRIEGELLLRAAEGLESYPGYSFGRHDEIFEAQMSSLDGGETDEAGKALLPVYLPVVDDPFRPLEAKITVRVAEGSGRPVERSVTKKLTPSETLIGIKPLFDGVAQEGGEARFNLIAVDADEALAAMPVTWKVYRINYDYQWYQSYGSWSWEPVVARTPVAEGEAMLGNAPVEIAARVDWGNYAIIVERADGGKAATSTEFYAGWYAPADTSATPDTLELSLDKPAYKSGDTATLRIVPRAAGTALITVLSNRLVAMQAVEVVEGENLITLPVTDEWGAGVYVTASVIRPMDVAAGRNPARALGLTHASIDPGARALTTTIEMAAEAAPRGPLEVAVKVEGVTAGETAYVTLAAVDVGILNLTGFEAPDPQDHYFGQRRLGVGIRDIYGRLIDGLNGAVGEVRSGGDAGAQARLQAPPPTEELVAYFTGPITVGADGYARTTFDLPSFNGTVKVMAVAWTKTGVGQASADVLVRDPVVVTASLPRFLSPGDTSRLLLEVVHATGPSGRMTLDVVANGLTLGKLPGGFDLADQAKAVFEVPVTSDKVGIHTIDVTLTTPDGKVLKKTLTIPVQINDPEVARVSRLEFKAGETFTFDGNVFADMVAGSGKATMAVGPLARLNAPGLLAALDRYPYGCTEQMTSKALPLLYFDQVAKVMDLKGAENIQARIDEAVAEILTNQASNGGFGLWGPNYGDFWLDAYVTDFLSRAKAQGYQVPEAAFRNALSNLRNQVNYAPDFSAEANGGGEALAYALMVLAREGAAAVGDLRYYADVKADDFRTPLAQAQLGAALASYGDQARADTMFRKAVGKMEQQAGPDTAQVWRVDYGTHYRDAAAVLTLAVESGSDAVDREALTDRIATYGSNLSTQEATWALLATNALIDRPGAEGITIDGNPADGPLVRVLDAASVTPVVVKNEGADTTLTITTYGVPSEPEPAGGNGYAIKRIYYTMDGQEVTLDNVFAGTRLVTVLEIIPFGYGEGRLMINDPLPAGFEIDNPNLMSAGSTSELSWLNTLDYAQYSEFRQDRFLTAVDWSSDQTFRLAYVVRAVSPGTYHHPAASVEDMYRPDFRARSETGTLTIQP